MKSRAENSVISVRGLQKSYGELPAIRGLDLEVQSGLMYGLIGPDGAGKTTLLRILCGLILPDGGEVRVMGFDPVGEQDRIKDLIGYMPQRFSLYPDLTVAENMRFFADIYNVPKAEREQTTRRLFQFSRLGPFADRKAGALSGGMKQKLALSCTLIHTPKLLILDEPTTGVDPVSRGEFWDILSELRREGVTILVTTPYMDEASLCHRITLMFQGRALVQGRPEHVTADFPHNIIRIYTDEVQSAGEALKRESGFGSVHLFGDRIHVAVSDVSTSLERIKKALENAQIAFSSIEEAKPDMEDVFVNLTASLEEETRPSKLNNL